MKVYSEEFGKRARNSSHEASDGGHSVVDCRAKITSDFSLYFGVICFTPGSSPFSWIFSMTGQSLELTFPRIGPPPCWGRKPENNLTRGFFLFVDDFFRNDNRIEFVRKGNECNWYVGVFFNSVIHRFHFLQLHDLHHSRSVVGVVDIAKRTISFPSLFFPGVHLHSRQNIKHSLSRVIEWSFTP